MIDILLATFNGEKYLEEQLDSLVNQTLKDIRIIIRDDASKDNTLKIINAYKEKDSRIILINDNKGNLGFIKNFEELMKNSTAEYIMFADQDDIWFLNKVEIMYNKIFEEEQEFGCEIPILVHANSTIMYNTKRTNNSFINKCAENNEFSNFFFNFFVQGSTCIINRKLKHESLPFPKKAYLHDRYLHILTEMIGRRIYHYESLMYYRQHKGNQIGSKSNYLKKLFTKKYYEEKDKYLIETLSQKYNNQMPCKKKESLKIYNEITSEKLGRIKKLELVIRYKVSMSSKKKVLLLLKG